ncbi:MAG: hypothetical protein D6718_07755 [Acidobacteria bacterium]|nr:MAG: hypothetical protein D6718_07755 [Acidobacteriota bacterium]
MRAWTSLVLAVGTAVAATAAFSAEPAETASSQPVFDTSMYRPTIVFLDAAESTDAAFVTVTGIVFSHAPIERVTVGERVAATRPAQPKDLMKLERVPEGATEAPFRTFFELQDAGLPRQGANDIEVRAHASDGRVSPLYRITIVRTTPVARDD